METSDIRPGLVTLDAATQRILHVIRDTGGDPWIVGGAVRDALVGAGTISKDVDIEVHGMDPDDPSEPDGPRDMESLAYRITESGVPVIWAGRNFGVLIVRGRNGSADLDIAAPRRDIKTGEGHRGFTIESGTIDFAEASGRRDFTINSMMWNPRTGVFLDCWRGEADMAAGILRHTTAAFAEDPLRVLRGVQFAARFGFALAPETAAFCRTLVDQFRLLPSERVWTEFSKIGTRGRLITAGLEALRVSGWEIHFPQIAALHGCEQDKVFHPEGNVHTHSGLAADAAAIAADAAGLTGEDRFVAVIGALVHDFGKPANTQRHGRGRITSHGHATGGVEPAREFLRVAGCPDGVAARILPVVREHMVCIDPPTKPAVRRLARRLTEGGTATLAEWALVCGADNAGRGTGSRPNPATAWLDMGRTLSVQDRPAKGILTGHHLIARGMQPGPMFKPILADALAAQDAGEFTDEAGALAWLRTWP